MTRPSKKQDIVQAATILFAEQGFDGTTTLQISKEAGITEPVIYYHFKGKDDLFTHILSSTFKEYFSHLEALNNNTRTEFEKIENLIDLHFRFVEELPNEIYLTVSTCPARLKDPEHTCAKNIQKQRTWLTSFLTECLEKGIESGEFNTVPVETTVSLITALINGLLRQRGLKLEHIAGLKEEAVEFCRRSLVKNGFEHR
jgi:AcrR family transcriptional regulator